MGTYLDPVDTENLESFSKKFKNIRISKKISSNLTYMITKAKKNSDGQWQCVRTYKIIFAMINKIPVVNASWVQNCYTNNKILDIQNYQITCDNISHEGFSNSSEGTFDNFLKDKFFTFAKMKKARKTAMCSKDVENIIKLLGGEILYDDEEFDESVGLITLAMVDHMTTSYDASDLKNTDDYNEVIVEYKWLLDCISHAKILSFDDYLIKTK